MRYRTAGAFRQALEVRLRQQSLGDHQALTRLRKIVVFDRILARLAKSDPDVWVLKGGFALQLRLPDRARTTRDIDVSVRKSWTREEVSPRLRRAARLDLRDCFEFEVGEPSEAATGAPQGGFRYPVRCLLDGRAFETFHVDVGLGDPISEAVVKLPLPNPLEFAGIRAATVRCCPLTVQIAEKLHAYTRAYAGGSTSRVRDLVDILIAGWIMRFSRAKLRRAIEATFQARGTHPVPEKMPEPPRYLAPPYRKLAQELNLPWGTIEQAGKAAAGFLNPVLQAEAIRRWKPDVWKWQ